MSDEPVVGADEAMAAVKVARADAIDAYAGLEQSLCDLFGYVAGTSSKVAGVIFYRITNARTRRVMLDKLMRLKHGDDRRPFFNALMKLLSNLDETRNQVVHWCLIASATGQDEGPSVCTGASLMHPDFWSWSDDSPDLDADALREFALKCDFARSATIKLLIALRVKPQDPSWRDISLEPLVYPPPADHPLARPQPEP